MGLESDLVSDALDVPGIEAGYAESRAELRWYSQFHMALQRDPAPEMQLA